MSAARAAARNKPVIVVKAGRAPARRAGRGLAHRRAGRLRRGLRRRDPARRHAARRHAAGPVHAAETLARVAAAGGERAGHPDQRRRRRRAGGRRRWRWPAARCADAGAATLRARSTRCCRRPGRTATRSTSSATRRSSATPRRWRRCWPSREADAVLFMHAPTAIVPQRRDRARLRCRSLRAGRAPRAGLLARRRRGGRGAPASSRDAGMPTYDTPEEAVRAFCSSCTYRRNQELLMRGAAGAAAGRRARPRAARAPSSTRRWPRAATCSTSPRPRRCWRAYGIPVVRDARRAPRADAAVAAAARDSATRWR